MRVKVVTTSPPLHCVSTLLTPPMSSSSVSEGSRAEMGRSFTAQISTDERGLQMFSLHSLKKHKDFLAKPLTKR